MVSARTPYFPDRARISRKHYPGKGRGDKAVWEGRPITLGDNTYAQQAWRKYTGRGIYRGSGYGVRHIWGYPWDPDAFTAGWNLCYMPFWAGMLTENQHPYPELQRAIKQASWDLFFRDNPVCTPPSFITDPGMNLNSVLGDQPVLLLGSKVNSKREASLPSGSPTTDVFEHVKQIRNKTNRSWVIICKGIRLLQGREKVSTSARNVQSNAKSIARRILRETALTIDQLEALLKNHGVWK